MLEEREAAALYGIEEYIELSPFTGQTHKPYRIKHSVQLMRLILNTLNYIPNSI